MKGKKGNSPMKGVVMADPPVTTAYSGGGSKTAAAAMKRKRGGAVMSDAKPEGMMAKKRFDRPGRKTGGRVGCDTAPLSSAARMSKPSGLDLDS